MKRIFHIILIITAFGLTACDNANQTQKDILNNIPFLATSNCHMLHKVTGVDDLVQQLYNNIDSACLFTMTTNELEAIWGIKVFDETSDDTDTRRAVFETSRHYYQEAQGIYVEKTKDKAGLRLHIQATKAYWEKFDGWHGDELGAGKIPTYLPRPDYKKFIETYHSSYTHPQLQARANDINDKYFVIWTMAIWLNANKSLSKPALTIEAMGSDFPVYPKSSKIHTSINFYQNAKQISNADKYLK